ncbi:MAG: fumarylacetoacetate hydrolase, partial [Arthrobacter sp.]
MTPIEPEAILPHDAAEALLIGRIWDPETQGPRPVLFHEGVLLDLFDQWHTVSTLLNRDDLPSALKRVRHEGARSWNLRSVLNPPDGANANAPHLLSPVD